MTHVVRPLVGFVLTHPIQRSYPLTLPVDLETILFPPSQPDGTSSSAIPFWNGYGFPNTVVPPMVHSGPLFMTHVVRPLVGFVLTHPIQRSYPLTLPVTLKQFRLVTGIQTARNMSCHTSFNSARRIQSNGIWDYRWS